MNRLIFLTFLPLMLIASNPQKWDLAQVHHMVAAAVPDGVELEVVMMDLPATRAVGGVTKKFEIDGHTFEKRVQKWLPAKVIISNTTNENVVAPISKLLHAIKLYGPVRRGMPLKKASSKDVYGDPKHKKKPFRGYTHPLFYASIPLSILGFVGSGALVLWTLSQRPLVGDPRVLLFPFFFFVIPPAIYAAKEENYKIYLRDQARHGGVTYTHDNQVVERFNIIPEKITLKEGQRYEMTIFGAFTEQEALDFGMPVV